MAPEFLCYRPAHRALEAGEITQEEYYHHLFQHLIWEHDCKGKGPIAEDVLGSQVKFVIGQSWHTVTDTAPFEKVFPAFRKGPDAFRSALLRVPEDIREPWYRAVAYIALKERDARSLKWALEGCKDQFSDKFEWEAYSVKQNRGTDPATDECWKVLVESGFQEPHHWQLKNPQRVLNDPMY